MFVGFADILVFIMIMKLWVSVSIDLSISFKSRKERMHLLFIRMLVKKYYS